MSNFTTEDLKDLQALRENLNKILDSLENTIDQVRDFNREISNLEHKQTEQDFQKLIDKGLVPGVYFRKDDSDDLFKITGIGLGYYLAINVTQDDGIHYKMPLTHYLTGESLAHRYDVVKTEAELC